MTKLCTLPSYPTRIVTRISTPLQPHSSELPPRRDVEARFLASSAAGQVLTGLAALEPQGAGSVRMTSVRHEANLLLDVVDAAVLSKWRHLPTCHRLVDDLVRERSCDDVVPRLDELRTLGVGLKTN